MKYDFQKEKYIIKKGSNVRALMRSYGIDIHNFSRFKYIRMHGDNENDHLFPNEYSLNEVRIELGKVYTHECLIYDYNSDDLEEVKSNWDGMSEEDIDIFNKRKEASIIEGTAIIEYTECSYSVFSNEDLNCIKKDDNIKKEFLDYLIGLSYNYFMNVMSLFNNNLKLNTNLEPYNDETYNFKLLLEKQQILIDNSNIEIIKNVSYRLYKDGKVLYDLERLLERVDSVYEDFINDLKNV